MIVEILCGCIYVCNKYLVNAVYIFRFVSSFTNINMIVVSYYDVNATSKYFVLHTQYIHKKFPQGFACFHELLYKKHSN